MTMSEERIQVDHFLTLPEVRERVHLGRTTIYRWMAEGRFPKAIPLASQVVRWRESEIERWMEAPVSWRQSA